MRVHALSVGGISATSGCLSEYGCSPGTQFDLVIINDIHEPQVIDVDIRSRWLGRDVFTGTFEVPAATNSFGQFEEEHVVRQPANYHISVTHDDETYSDTWRTNCDDLELWINDPDEQGSGVGIGSRW